MTHSIGNTLGQYQLTEVLGRGSTATVYRAFQPSLGRYVAIKVLHAHLDLQFTSRFQREAQAIAQLHHPNILPIYDYGEQDGRRYFVTQYIENGRTLGSLMGEAPLDALTALRLVDRLLDALAYAHQRGVIHRDIKPSNVLLPGPEWPMLADFGIAKLLDETSGLTPPGQTVGTAAYMAPERALDQPADARTDLYSVGVVLYEMVTGRVPYEGITPAAVMMKHVNEPLPPPRSLNAELPPAVERVLFRALEKDPQLRYQSASEMSADVRRAIGELERARAQRELAGLLAGGVQPVRRYTTDKLVPVGPARPTPIHTGSSPTSRAGGVDPIRRGQLLLPLLAVAGLLLVLLSLWPRGPGEEAAVGTPAPSAAPAPTAAPAAEPPAAPTPAPAPTAVPAAEPPAPPPATPAPTAAPATEAPATEAPTAPTPPAAPASQPALSAENPLVRLEDTDWAGGLGGAGGQRQYGGRTATWIYGVGTEYSTMRALFTVEGQPVGTAELRIEGMDSEGRAKTEIGISLNGVEIYRGPNPLPDDDIPLESGTWATYAWTFDAGLLRPGSNEISVSNLSPGEYSLPPFVMLDYAEVALGG